MIIYRFEGKTNICGENVRRLRIYQNMTQGQLAARLQSHYNVQLEQRAISRIETGERFVADFEILALSKALGVELEELYRGVSLEDNGGE